MRGRGLKMHKTKKIWKKTHICVFRRLRVNILDSIKLSGLPYRIKNLWSYFLMKRKVDRKLILIAALWLNRYIVKLMSFFSNVASYEPWLDLTISPWPTQRLTLKLIYLDRGDQFKTWFKNCGNNFQVAEAAFCKF